MNRIHLSSKQTRRREKLNGLMCICSLGPAIRDFDPKPALKTRLGALFRKKNCRGRSLRGGLNELLGVRGGRAWAFEKHCASELQRPLRDAFLRAFSGNSHTHTQYPNRELTGASDLLRNPLFSKNASWGKAPGELRKGTGKLPSH